MKGIVSRILIVFALIVTTISVANHDRSGRRERGLGLSRPFNWGYKVKGGYIYNNPLYYNFDSIYGKYGNGRYNDYGYGKWGKYSSGNWPTYTSTYGWRWGGSGYGSGLSAYQSYLNAYSQYINNYYNYYSSYNSPGSYGSYYGSRLGSRYYW